MVVLLDDPRFLGVLASLGRLALNAVDFASDDFVITPGGALTENRIALNRWGCEGCRGPCRRSRLCPIALGTPRLFNSRANSRKALAGRGVPFENPLDRINSSLVAGHDDGTPTTGLGNHFAGLHPQTVFAVFVDEHTIVTIGGRLFRGRIRPSSICPRAVFREMSIRNWCFPSCLMPYMMRPVKPSQSIGPSVTVTSSTPASRRG